METENIKAFIKYGVDEKQTQPKIIFGCWGVATMAMTASIIGFFHRQTIWMAIVVYLFSIAFFILSCVMSQKLTLKKRVQCSAIITVFTAFLFSMSGAIYFNIVNVWWGILVCCLPVLLAIISVLVCIIRLRKSQYSKKKNDPKYNNMLAFAAIGSVIGYLGFKKLSDYMASIVIPAEIVVALLLCLVACLFTIMGAPTILKLYYISKLTSQGIDLED